MKICPECSTQYESHVEYCLIDGAELEEKEETPAAAATPAAAKAAGAGVLGLAFVGLAIVGLIGVVGAVFVFSGGEADATAAAPAPKPPAPEPKATPKPVEAPVLRIGLTSEPAGAVVIENGITVCTTPCTIEHPPQAPLPRTLSFEAEGHEPKALEVTDASVPWFVKLDPIQSARPRPRPNPRPTPTAPSPSPKAPAPSIGMSR